MIVLDTNVVSEGMRLRPEPNVQRWLDAQQSIDLYLCTPVLAELRFGMERLPPGPRRAKFESAVRNIEAAFSGRILPFDQAAAHEYGRIVAARERSGRPAAVMDGLIAAIASLHGAAIATRDGNGFGGFGLVVINPFDPDAGERN